MPSGFISDANDLRSALRDGIDAMPVRHALLTQDSHAPPPAPQRGQP